MEVENLPNKENWSCLEILEFCLKKIKANLNDCKNDSSELVIDMVGCQTLDLLIIIK